MGILAPKDLSSNPAPPEVYNWRVYALAISAAMGSSMFGYDSSFIGGSLSLPSFRERFGLADASSAERSSLSAHIVSTFQAGCFFGAIFCYIISERLGLKKTLMLCGAVFDIGTVLQVASTGQLGLIYAGRVLTGLAVGASSLIVPVYISECSPPAIRGRLIGIFEIVLQLSQIVGFWVNYGVNKNISGSDDSQWRIPFGLQFVPGTLLVVLMALQPESPRWLAKKGKFPQAQRTLSILRQCPEDHEYLAWELHAIRSQIEAETAESATSLLGKLKEIYNTNVRTRLLIAMALMMLQNLSGINALNYYSPTIFKSIGFTGTDVGLLATGVFGIVKATMTTIFMLFLVDRFGRRPAMLVGSAGAIVAMYYLAGYTKMSNSFNETPPRDGGAYIAIVMIYIFSIFYAISWNGIPWIFSAEVFPIEVRQVCLVFTTCTQWLGQFMIAYSTPYMITGIQYGVFLFFGTSVVIGVTFVFFFLPETKEVALEDMDIMFNVKGWAWQKRKETERILAERRLQLQNDNVIVVDKGDHVHLEGESAEDKV
ncbi:hypothetical protein RBB50_004882 [Rhinocladiella similis]